MNNQQTTSSKQPKPPSDFNDLFILRGLDVVRAQLAAAMPATKESDLPTPHQEAIATPKDEGLEQKTVAKNNHFLTKYCLKDTH